MRQLVCCAALFAVILFSGVKAQINADVPIDPYIFEDVINSTIEGIRPDIPDPILVESYEVVLTEEAANGTLSISNLEIDGLKGFQITALNLALIGFQFNFTVAFSEIDFYTDYLADIQILSTIPVFGNGSISAIIDTLEIQGSAQVNLTGGVSVNNLNVQLYLGNATFEIHGLYNDEELSDLISHILNDLAAPLIDQYQELVSSIISPIIEDLVNTLLGELLTPTTTVPPIEELLGVK